MFDPFLDSENFWQSADNLANNLNIDQDPQNLKGQQTTKAWRITQHAKS